jgi:hypothetical protein
MYENQRRVSPLRDLIVDLRRQRDRRPERCKSTPPPMLLMRQLPPVFM